MNSNEKNTEAAFNELLAQEMAKRTDKLNDSTIDLAIRLKQAREFMAWSASHVRTAWLDWTDQSGKASADLTQARMHFERESKAMVAMGKDVRDFFASAEYSKALSAMADTMALVEKFSQLKKDGTLDAFADFILKVTVK